MKFLVSTALFTISLSAWSCPSCMGSVNDPKSGNIVWILGGFILLTYIPFYLIYKTIFKNRNINQIPQANEPK